jgi:hypothetical protein
MQNSAEGTKPSGLPIYQPTKFDPAVGMKMAKALGKRLSDAFLDRSQGNRISNLSLG